SAELLGLGVDLVEESSALLGPGDLVCDDEAHRHADGDPAECPECVHRVLLYGDVRDPCFKRSAWAPCGAPAQPRRPKISRQPRERSYCRAPRRKIRVVKPSAIAALRMSTAATSSPSHSSSPPKALRTRAVVPAVNGK